MVEDRESCTIVPHHKKSRISINCGGILPKLCVLCLMRLLLGYQLFSKDHDINMQEVLRSVIKLHSSKEVLVTQPSDYHVDEAVSRLCQR